MCYLKEAGCADKTDFEAQFRCYVIQLTSAYILASYKVEMDHDVCQILAVVACRSGVRVEAV